MGNVTREGWRGYYCDEQVGYVDGENSNRG